MLFKSLNVILALCLLTLTYCSAMHQAFPYGRSSSSRGKIEISEATCGNRKYNSQSLNRAATSAKEMLDNKERLRQGLSLIEYIPRREEIIRFNPPYFLHRLIEEATNYPADFVVVTREGKIAKVVTQATSPIGFMECQVKYARSSIS